MLPDIFNSVEWRRLNRRRNDLGNFYAVNANDFSEAWTLDITTLAVGTRVQITKREAKGANNATQAGAVWARDEVLCDDAAEGLSEQPYDADYFGYDLGYTATSGSIPFHSPEPIFTQRERVSVIIMASGFRVIIELG